MAGEVPACVEVQEVRSVVGEDHTGREEDGAGACGQGTLEVRNVRGLGVPRGVAEDDCQQEGLLHPLSQC